MTEMIYGWMKNLAFFFIFMTAVLNCLPDNRYRKYVRFFLGMLVIDVYKRQAEGCAVGDRRGKRQRGVPAGGGFPDKVQPGGRRGLGHPGDSGNPRKTVTHTAEKGEGA